MGWKSHGKKKDIEANCRCWRHHILDRLEEIWIGTEYIGSRDSSVGIATGYGLDDQGGAGVRVPVG
jgi:hypothetical protein